MEPHVEAARWLEAHEEADHHRCTVHRAKLGLPEDVECVEDCEDAECWKGCPFR